MYRAHFTENQTTLQLKYLVVHTFDNIYIKKKSKLND